MHVPKLLKDELGGGKKEFSLADGELQSILLFKRIIYQSPLQEATLSISRRPRLFSAAQTDRASSFTSSTPSGLTRATLWPR